MLIAVLSVFAIVKIIQTDGLEVLAKTKDSTSKIHDQANELIVNAENLKSCHIKGPQLISFKAIKKNGDVTCTIPLPLDTHIPFPSALELITVGSEIETVKLQNVPSRVKIEVTDIEEEPFAKLKEIKHTFGEKEDSGSWFLSFLGSAVCIALPWMYLLFQMSKVKFRVYTSGLLFLSLIVLHLGINFNFWYQGTLFPTLFQHFFAGILTTLVGHRALVQRIKKHGE